MDENRCTRVTGKAFEPHYWTLPEERRGPRRAKDEVDMSRVGLGRTRPVWDVFCGDQATYWVRNDSLDFLRCCTRCLSVTIDKLSETGAMGLPLPLTVGRIEPTPCEETDEFGGECCYRKGHEIPCRFVGGDEDARYAAALTRHQEERLGR